MSQYYSVGRPSRPLIKKARLRDFWLLMERATEQFWLIPYKWMVQQLLPLSKNNYLPSYWGWCRNTIQSQLLFEYYGEWIARVNPSVSENIYPNLKPRPFLVEAYLVPVCTHVQFYCITNWTAISHEKWYCGNNSSREPVGSSELLCRNLTRHERGMKIVV